jgi:GDP-L-fucose synthase
MYGKMIWFGSGAEYGRQNPIVRVSEEDFDRVLPSDDYGFCLHQMSQDTKRSDNIYNFRLFGIFGKYEIWKQRFISNAICKGLYGYPITIRQDRVMDYLHIDDLCRITEWACENKPTYHDYNATSGKAYRLTELADIVNSKLDEAVPVFVAKEGYFSEYTSNNDRLLKDFSGFRPESMDESVEKLMAYYKHNIESIKREDLLY